MEFIRIFIITKLIECIKKSINQPKITNFYSKLPVFTLRGKVKKESKGKKRLSLKT